MGHAMVCFRKKKEGRPNTSSTLKRSISNLLHASYWCLMLMSLMLTADGLCSMIYYTAVYMSYTIDD